MSVSLQSSARAAANTKRREQRMRLLPKAIIVLEPLQKCEMWGFLVMTRELVE